MLTPPAVEGVNNGITRRERRNLGFCEVSDSSIYSTFEKVNFGEDHLVVETLKFGEEGSDECESRFVLLSVQLSMRESIRKNGIV
jgi:hypothetical protein